MTPFDPGDSRLLAAFQADVLHGAPLPRTAIHPDDSMLRFFLERRHRHRERAVVDYFRTGHSAARAIERLLQWWFVERRPAIRVLDFASGYGRITRFLVQRQAPQKLWVADLFRAAVDFQRERFGVNGFVSSAEPAELACEETFDCIVTSSLFSHLPPATFEAWLRRLLSLLRPDGMLLFSVHDVSLRPLFGKAPLSPAELARSDGIHFEPDSEIPGLEGYGTTWVEESFVRRAVAAAGAGACVCLPRALSSFQDYYAVGRTPPAQPPPQVAEPIGYLEGAVRSADGRAIALHGWAHDLYGPGIDTVEVRVDGAKVASCAVEHSRPDVAAFFGEADLRAGWAVTVESSSARALDGDAMISVQAVSRSGLAHLIHLGSIEATELGLQLDEEHARRQRAEAEAIAARAAARAAAASAAALTSELDRMRSSRFWRLRDAWWRLKSALGLARADDASLR